MRVCLARAIAALIAAEIVFSAGGASAQVVRIINSSGWDIH
jgi:hypothetical protein